ncbi:site-specific integrase [Mucilaginibacter daejeonensis]|uniref:site-specific integrase n=1 Tax=Mucilaginibacter daejeonensis TaxID=398049 RepID=UPI001D176996|nr:site-specific integrase [Mucilaginibacter daejeonensis]UEG53424.1 site-specific integrase [Mucilaginibacter daejeonensis]
MASLAIVLNTTYKLSNGEYAVALRVTHERKQKYYAISTLVTDNAFTFKCSTKDWIAAGAEDNGLGKFRRSFTNYKECNELLRQKLNDAHRILKRYEDTNTMFSFQGFEVDLKNKPQLVVHGKSTVTVDMRIHEYYNQHIKILEEQGRVGLAGLYLEVQNILKKFKPNALLSDVNIRFLESFEYWMRNIRGNKDTTISVKMRNLQRVVNQAIDEKLFKQESYPFGERKYSINKRLNSKTKKIAITLDKIGKLRSLTLEPESALHLAQQMFLFSYYSRGMNFIDMSYLTWNDISETHINYTRRKTGGQFEIPFNEHNLEILNYYKAHHRVIGNFVFPIFDLAIHKTLKQQYTRKKTALKAVNDNLKKLAAMIGEPNLKLTTNVGRHTYATGLKRSGANTSYISEALGHATEEQTQTYLDSFERGAIESWEKKMFES